MKILKKKENWKNIYSWSHSLCGWVSDALEGGRNETKRNGMEWNRKAGYNRIMEKSTDILFNIYFAIYNCLWPNEMKPFLPFCGQPNPKPIG